MKKPRSSRGRRSSRMLALCQRLLPPTITGKESVSQLVDGTFLAYNSARLREACGLLVREVLKSDVVAGWSFPGALTLAGPGESGVLLPFGVD